MKDKIEYIAFLILTSIVKLFDFEHSGKVAKTLSRFFFKFIPLRKNVVKKNLKIAFPNLHDENIEELIKENYLSSFQLLIELILFKKIDMQHLDRYIYSHNDTVINEIVDRGKGLFLLTAHFGNWELGALYIGKLITKPFYVLAKPQRNNYITDWLTSQRTYSGNREIKLGVSVREIYKAIKNGNVVGVVGDQRGSREGMRVKFFGRETAVYPGTATIALKNNTPILTAFVVREKSGRYRIDVEEIKYQNLDLSDEDKIKYINQKYMNLLENKIRDYPEQWFWMHNIWKY